MKLLVLTLMFLATMAFVSPSQNPPQPDTIALKPSIIKSFSRSKKELLNIYLAAGMDKTLYCGCGFDSEKKIDYSACGYKPRKATNKRSQRLEWEHVMPAFKFGKVLRCWREPICNKFNGRPFGGRKCCSQVSPEFNQMEADMHNLFPAIGEINASRSNYPFGEIPGELRKYGICDIEINREIAEPTENIQEVSLLSAHSTGSCKPPIHWKLFFLVQKLLFSIYERIIKRFHLIY